MKTEGMEKEISELEKASLSYFDEIEKGERRLKAIARLIQGFSNPDKEMEGVFEEIGALLVEYFEQKRVYDHFFLDRFIDPIDLERPEAKAILYVLEELHGNHPFTTKKPD